MLTAYVCAASCGVLLFFAVLFAGLLHPVGSCCGLRPPVALSLPICNRRNIASRLRCARRPRGSWSAPAALDKQVLRMRYLQGRRGTNLGCRVLPGGLGVRCGRIWRAVYGRAGTKGALVGHDACGGGFPKRTLGKGQVKGAGCVGRFEAGAVGGQAGHTQLPGIVHIGSLRCAPIHGYPKSSIGLLYFTRRASWRRLAAGCAMDLAPPD